MFVLHPLPNEFPLRRTSLSRPHIAYAPIYTQKDNKSVPKILYARTTQTRICSGSVHAKILNIIIQDTTQPYTKNHVVSHPTRLPCCQKSASKPVVVIV